MDGFGVDIPDIFNVVLRKVVAYFKQIALVLKKSNAESLVFIG
jgi:hypothetical protein